MKSVGMFGGMLMMMMATAVGASATVSEKEDKTLSPYFFVKSDEGGADQLPLKATRAQVSIAGVIADVKVTQEYKNEGKQTLEAIYTFPASTRASVYGMKMTIGERTIIAKIQEREQARQEYEQAKQEGKSASLLEQQRPNVFQMNVANILPGDVIQVELSYTELLVPTDGIYEFVYPTVVGPRYSNQPEASAPASEQWVKSPYLHEGEAPTYTFDIGVNISGSMKLQDVSCKTHKTDIRFDGPSLAVVKLDESEKSGGNRDFILKYRLAGGKVETGLLLYEGKDENFFLLMLQPPKDVTQAQIPPREYIFIVDVSGSMSGFPLDISKELLKNLIGNLRPTDKFNVLLFSGAYVLLSEQSLPATPDNISKAVQTIDQQRGGGGTELLPALERALALKGTENYSRSVIIATDGYVTVEKETFDLIRKSLGEANMFAFGIGSSVNRFIIEGMARVGMGEPFIVTNPGEASGKAEKLRKYIQSPVLTRAKVDFSGFDTYDVEPPGIPDVLAERPVIIFGKWKGQPKGKIRLTGISGNQNSYSETIDVSQFRPLEVNSALPYLWARHKIALLSDYSGVERNEANKKEITGLGLKYNLLTAYTSFIAVDSLVRNKDGKSTTVNQPLPLPEGVSDYAVGGAAMPAMVRSRGFSMKSLAAPMEERQMAVERQVSMSEPSPPPAPEPEAAKTDMADTDMADKEKKAEPSLIGTVTNLSEKTVVTGSLSKADAERILAQYLKDMQQCYQTALLKNPALQWAAMLKIVIDASGKITDVTLTSDTLTDEDMKACIIALVRQWHFTAFADGKAASAEYALIFKP
jgi:Ca-activated chloride channel homolog